MFDNIRINRSSALSANNQQRRLKSAPLSFKSSYYADLKNRKTGSIKTGWVLDIGGAKGVFQTGAMEALIDAGYMPDIIKGTSVGALNTAFWLGNGGHIEGLKEIWNMIYLRKILDFSLKQFNSILDNTPLRQGINTHVNTDLVFDRLNMDGMELVIHSTEVEEIGVPNKKALFATEKAYQRLKEKYKDDECVKVYRLTKDNFRQVVLSSGAIPVIFPSEMIDEKKFFDGGICANKPSEDGEIALGSILEQGQKGVSFVVLCHPPREGDLEVDAQKLKEMGLDEEDVKTVVISPSTPLGVKFLSFNKAGNEADDYLDRGYAVALSKLKSEGLLPVHKYVQLIDLRRKERLARKNFELVA